MSTDITALHNLRNLCVNIRS